jgi:hypothetical protein
LALALARGKTVKEAARIAGMSRRTATRPLREPDLRAKVNGFRKGMVDQALGRLVESMTTAADTLKDLCKDDQPAAVRLHAARSIIDGTVKVAEFSNFEERLQALEREIKKPL